MKDDIKALMDMAWAEHRGSVLGVLLGVIVSVSILLFGFWRVLFVAFFAAAGLWIGIEVDRGDDVWYRKLQGLRLRDIFYRKH